MPELELEKNKKKKKQQQAEYEEYEQLCMERMKQQETFNNKMKQVKKNLENGGPYLTQEERAELTAELEDLLEDNDATEDETEDDTPNSDIDD